MNKFEWAAGAKAFEDRVAGYGEACDQGGIYDATTFEVGSGFFKNVKFPPSVRFMTREGDEEFELVFKIPGILGSKMLPPLKRPPTNPSTSKLRNLKQYCKVTGCGSVRFDAATATITAIYDAFQKHVGASKVQPLVTMPHEGRSSLESHARYFTDRDLVPYEENQVFLAGVDSFNVLRDLQPDIFIHAQDNRVEYCIEHVGEDGRKSVHPFDPALFCVGDFVEMAFSFVGIPIKNEKFKVILNLRGLTLLDSSLRLACERAQDESQSALLPTIVPKRRRLYLDQQGDAAPGSQTSPSLESDGVQPTEDDRPSFPQQVGGNVNTVAEKMNQMQVDRE